MIFYAKLQEGVYLKVSAPSLSAARQLVPETCQRIYTQAYFYEVERKRVPNIKVIEHRPG